MEPAQPILPAFLRPGSEDDGAAASSQMERHEWALRAFAAPLRAEGVRHLIFLTEAREDTSMQLADMAPRRELIRRVAADGGAALVDAQAVLAPTSTSRSSSTRST